MAGTATSAVNKFLKCFVCDTLYFSQQAVTIKSEKSKFYSFFLSELNKKKMLYTAKINIKKYQ